MACVAADGMRRECSSSGTVAPILVPAVAAPGAVPLVLGGVFRVSVIAASVWASVSANVVVHAVMSEVGVWIRSFSCQCKEVEMELELGGGLGLMALTADGRGQKGLEGQCCG